MRTQKQEQKLIDNIIKLLTKYEDKITMLATNQYHNTNTDDDIDLIECKLNIFYGNQVLDNKVTLDELEITLANR
tara:strand:+ start:1360 stop:1584 length:225 start_codon:yes stop_codon:yes gene_type:complete